MAKVLTDGFTTIQTAFMNLGKNMTSVWDAFLDFVKTGKFEPKFTGLLDGLKVVAAEFPEMVKPVFTDFSNQIQAIEDRIAAREAAGFAKHAGARRRQRRKRPPRWREQPQAWDSRPRRSMPLSSPGK